MKEASKSTRGRNKTLVWGIHDFKHGKLMIVQDSQGLCWLGINCDEKRLAREWPGAELVEDKKTTEKAAKEIARFWPHSIEKISVPVVLYGTPFQLKVWKELLKIKAGKTSTYETIAKKIGSPKAVRAVGTACGKNTVSIVVPCHRVINKSGSRINYGWGPATKLALLKGEGAI